MPSYRIYHMKESAQQHFRWAPHVSGAANVKRKDYEEGGEVEAANEYAAWEQLRHSERPLGVGDLLETGTGELRICKFIGFEAASWVLPPVDQPAVPDASLTTTPASPIGYTSADRPNGD